jgi:hypothetical protein
MNVATNKFLNNLLACQRIKANPVLWQHFNAENKNLGVKNLTEDNKIKAQCHYCYTTKQPKLIVKRLKKQRGKEVKRKALFFCSLCGIKMKQLCGQMPQRKVVKIEIESCPVLQKIEASTVKESKSAKKKKKKDVNAGLIVPQSLVKPGIHVVKLCSVV